MVAQSVDQFDEWSSACSWVDSAQQLTRNERSGEILKIKNRMEEDQPADKMEN
jgi:hypothetical protein